MNTTSTSSTSSSSSTIRQKCRVVLNHCLAIIVRKDGCRGDPGDFWMYENGYLLFQGLISSNSVCWWNTALNSATKNLTYHGYTSPGAILIGAEPCAIDIIKNAWSRRVLQPPPGYQIVALEELEECYGAPVCQTQWTPLSEAVCAVVLRLSRQGRPAGLATIREALILTFPHVSPPGEQTLYDTLAQLSSERKLYHTSNGYFIMTPERRRSRSHSRSRRRYDDDHGRPMLMSNDEALVMVHGDMATYRDGDVTHQLIQTNLADVICGGNSSDKILYPRQYKSRSASLSVQRSPDRKGSFRLWRSNRRLKRSASTRSITRQQHYVDSSSSTTENSDNPQLPSRKESLLSRLFRKSKRSQCQIHTFSAQFPPTEWFNSKAVHLHSVGTQTSTKDKDLTNEPHKSTETTIYRSATLPRRHPSTVNTNNNNTSKHIATLPRNSGKKSKTVRKLAQRPPKTDDVKISPTIDTSGPSSIDSKTESSLTSGPSSLESHKTVIDRSPKIQTNTTNNSFTLQVTTSPTKLNNNGTKIYVENSPIRSVITFENGQKEENNKPNLVIINDTEKFKNTNQESTNNTLLKNQENGENQTMNNGRKLSLQLGRADSFTTYKNLIKNVPSGINSTPSSPTISSNVYIKNDVLQPTTKLEKNIVVGSEPNISYKELEKDHNGHQQYPSLNSLNDLTFNFTSLAAQKILKGVGLNSVDTLVELNMTTTANCDAGKPNNCDVVHTDFGVF